ncbi:MAG: cation:proton antiporter [Alicyclobacillus sp.]|nr:cation:proton antiporter [Alicyclobacillus sp.]
MVNVWWTAAVWMGMALLASLISVRIGVAVALVEIVLGCLAGNAWHLQTTPWVDFLASVGSVLITFLAGAEIDPASLRRHFKVSVTVGTASFLLPFLGATMYAYWLAGWSFPAAKLAGIALSTTSVAVVYAVMVETGLNVTDLGKAILAACFVTDLGTVLALGVLFSGFSGWMAVFAVVTLGVLVVLPRLTRWFLRHYGWRAQQAEIRFFCLLLFGLGALATVAQSEAVLPAYVTGLVLAGVFQQFPDLTRHLRVLAFSLLTPFYFLKAGLFVLIPAVWHNILVILAFFAVKMVAKILGVRPLTDLFRYPRREGNYTTLLMATGLTFGTISSLYGLSHQIINQTQYTVLVTVVILSAFVPTLIAQTWFQPRQTRLSPAADMQPGVHELESVKSDA